MIRWQWHVPNYFDTDEKKGGVVATVADLLNEPWIKTWTEPVTDRGVVQTFTRWSLADGNTLMAEYNDNAHWWVVAYLRSDQPIDLPTWAPPKEQK